MNDATERMKMAIDRAKALREDRADELREKISDIKDMLSAAEAELDQWLKMTPHSVLMAEQEFYRREAIETERKERENEERKIIRYARECAANDGKLIAAPGSIGELIISAWLFFSISSALTMATCLYFGIHSDLKIIAVAIASTCAGLFSALHIIASHVVIDKTLTPRLFPRGQHA